MTFRCDALHPHLRLGEYRNIFEAAAFAERLGCPLNMTFTIHWGVAGGDGHWRNQQERFLDLLGRFLRHHGARKKAVVWVAEIDPQGKGPHIHGALHVPLHRTGFGYREVEGYMLKLLGNPPERVLKVDQVSRHPYGLTGWLRYSTKALDREHRSLVPKPWRKHPQGPIYGKRSGTSKAIGRTARKCAGIVYTWDGGRLIAPPPVPAFTQSPEINERIEARHRRRYGP